MFWIISGVVVYLVGIPIATRLEFKELVRRNGRSGETKAGAVLAGLLWPLGLALSGVSRLVGAIKALIDHTLFAPTARERELDGVRQAAWDRFNAIKTLLVSAPEYVSGEDGDWFKRMENDKERHRREVQDVETKRDYYRRVGCSRGKDIDRKAGVVPAPWYPREDR